MKTVADDPRNPHLDEERLNDFVDQLLSEVAEAQVRRHLDACAACRAEVAELRALLNRTAGLPLAVTPPRDLWTGIRERCAGEDAPSCGTRTPRLMALPSAPPPARAPPAGALLAARRPRPWPPSS
jgi:anti-sigma factor RsiW